MAPVPESVRRSMSTLAEASRKRLYPASFKNMARSSREVIRMGSTVLILNGSMIVWNESGPVILSPGDGTLLRQLEPRADPLEKVFDGHLCDPVKQGPVGDLPDEPKRWLVVGAEAQESSGGAQRSHLQYSVQSREHSGIGRRPPADGQEHQARRGLGCADFYGD